MVRQSVVSFGAFSGEMQKISAIKPGLVAKAKGFWQRGRKGGFVFLKKPTKLKPGEGPREVFG